MKTCLDVTFFAIFTHSYSNNNNNNSSNEHSFLTTKFAMLIQTKSDMF